MLLGTHGTFASIPTPPDFTKRGNPDHRILAIGHWGTYKRLETLMEAFPMVLKKVPNARLIVAGANHHTKAGYWESIRDAQPAGLPIEFRGYVPEEDIPELFQTTSIVVMPYDSATGSSGPAHQACEFGIPIVCADIEDLRRYGGRRRHGGPNSTKKATPSIWPIRSSPFSSRLNCSTRWQSTTSRLEWI